MKNTYMIFDLNGWIMSPQVIMFISLNLKCYKASLVKIYQTHLGVKKYKVDKYLYRMPENINTFHQRLPRRTWN